MSDPRAALATRQLKPKKSFGQNFLIVPRYVDAIADACVEGQDHPLVVELGAGTGVLTAALLARGAKVVAVERDRDLIPLLEAELAEAIQAGRLTLLEADAKNIDLAEILRTQGRSRCVLAGNLPYQLTGPLLERATQNRDLVSRVVFLVQKEVAERLAASPRSKVYGALTVFVNAQFAVRMVAQVPSRAFYPAPEVDSAVVAFTPREPALSAETETFQRVVRAAFAQRRKTLRNAWSKLTDSARLAVVAERAGISLDQRGEELGVETFAAIARALDQ